MTLAELLRLAQIFEHHEWSIEHGPAPYPALFHRCCLMLEKLSTQERACALEILAEYRFIQENERTSILLSAWKQLTTSLQPKSVWIAPILKPHSRTPKSSQIIWDRMKEYKEVLELSNVNVGFLRSHKKQFKRRKSTDLLVLVDDYVGSGETALEFLADVFDFDPSRTSENTALLFLAGQSIALENLGKRCHVFAQIHRRRCISDDPKVAPYIDVLRTLGGKLGFGKTERLGYANTEAAITIMRTPNNTLPMFWTNRKVGNTVWPAPFPRGNDRET